MMAELPLALFTTLAPIGAGAFIALAVAFFTTKFSDEQLKKIDRMTTIPVVVLVAGFICAFFHLASPMHAFGVFAAWVQARCPTSCSPASCSPCWLSCTGSWRSPASLARVLARALPPWWP